jgi:hypothetical protein
VKDEARGVIFYRYWGEVDDVLDVGQGEKACGKEAHVAVAGVGEEVEFDGDLG